MFSFFSKFVAMLHGANGRDGRWREGEREGDG